MLLRYYSRALIVFGTIRVTLKMTFLLKSVRAVSRQCFDLSWFSYAKDKNDIDSVRISYNPNTGLLGRDYTNDTTSNMYNNINYQT